MKFAASKMQSIYQELVEYARPNTVRWARSAIVLTGIGSAAIAVAFICLLLGGRSPKSSRLLLAGMILLLCAQFIGVVLLILPIREAGQRLRRTFSFQKFLQLSAEYAEKDRQIAETLSHSNESALLFVANRLRSDADGIRGRTSILVGALDKIGLLPLLATVPYSLSTIMQLLAKSPVLAFRSFFWFAVGTYVLLVFGGFGAIGRADRLNYMAGLVDLALLIKQEKPGERQR
jgi:hypothetical protein